MKVQLSREVLNHLLFSVGEGVLCALAVKVWNAAYPRFAFHPFGTLVYGITGALVRPLFLKLGNDVFPDRRVTVWNRSISLGEAVGMAAGSYMGATAAHLSGYPSSIPYWKEVSFLAFFSLMLGKAWQVSGVSSSHAPA